MKMPAPPRPVLHSTRSPGTPSTCTTPRHCSRWSSRLRPSVAYGRKPFSRSTFDRSCRHDDGEAAARTRPAGLGSGRERGPPRRARRSSHTSRGTSAAPRSRGSARRAARSSAARGTGSRPARGVAGCARSCCAARICARRRMFSATASSACWPSPLSMLSSAARSSGRRASRSSSTTIARPKKTGTMHLAHRAAVLGEEVVERRHHAVARAAFELGVAHRRVDAAGLEQLLRPRLHARRAGRAGGTRPGSARARSTGRGGRTAIRRRA